MSPTSRVVATAAAVGLVAIIGIAIASGSNVGQNDASATPTPSDSPAASPDEAGALPSAGTALPPGTYTTAFDPAFRVTIPEGWRVGGNTAEEFGLVVAAIDSVGFFICHDSRAVDPTNNELPGVGSDAQSVVTALAERADLRDMSEPQAVDIGGLSGYYVDFLGPKPSDDIPPAPAAIGGGCGIDAYPSQLSRIGVFDGPDGNIAIIITSIQGDPNIIEAATAIVESIEFDVP
ncbi:MAG TPA: hypothetical protein VF114_09475 [Candidatus Limnocylindria bacterium]